MGLFIVYKAMDAAACKKLHRI
jgi:hypothetical protein